MRRTELAAEATTVDFRSAPLGGKSIRRFEDANGATRPLGSMTQGSRPRYGPLPPLHTSCARALGRGQLDRATVAADHRAAFRRARRGGIRLGHEGARTRMQGSRPQHRPHLGTSPRRTDREERPSLQPGGPLAAPRASGTGGTFRRSPAVFRRFSGAGMACAAPASRLPGEVHRGWSPGSGISPAVFRRPTGPGTPRAPLAIWRGAARRERPRLGRSVRPASRPADLRRISGDLPAIVRDSRDRRLCFFGVRALRPSTTPRPAPEADTARSVTQERDRG